MGSSALKGFLGFLNIRLWAVTLLELCFLEIFTNTSITSMHLAYALYIFNIVIMFEILKNICLKRLRVWELVVDNYSKLNIMASDRNRGIGNEHYLEF